MTSLDRLIVVSTGQGRADSVRALSWATLITSLGKLCQQKIATEGFNTHPINEKDNLA